MIEWTDEETKAYRRDFYRTCKGVFEDDFAKNFDGCNVLHHAVKAGNCWAVTYLRKFFIERVNTNDFAWQEFMMIRDSDGKSVYENAPNEEFEVWLSKREPIY